MCRDGRVLAGLEWLAKGRLEIEMLLTCVHRRCTEPLWPRSLSSSGCYPGILNSLGALSGE